MNGEGGRSPTSLISAITRFVSFSSTACHADMVMREGSSASKLFEHAFFFETIRMISLCSAPVTPSAPTRRTAYRSDTRHEASFATGWNSFAEASSRPSACR